jgi:hypothetical protein
LGLLAYAVALAVLCFLLAASLDIASQLIPRPLTGWEKVWLAAAAAAIFMLGMKYGLGI